MSDLRAKATEAGRDIGGFIRDLRRNAGVSLRQLADRAGVSNPYLSQIERGLRKPSAEVLQQIGSALKVSTPVMYLRAGLLEATDSEGVIAAIAADPDLTMAQKQSLTQIYQTFRRENARATQATDEDEEHGADSDAEPSVAGTEKGGADDPPRSRKPGGRNRPGEKKNHPKKSTSPRGKS